jgi:hypothetical protein
MKYRWNKLHFLVCPSTSEVLHAGSGKRVGFGLEDRVTRDNPSGSIIATSKGPVRAVN